MTTFWCKTHLEYLPISKQSTDGRYCQNCYDLLVEEAKLEPRKKKWMPDPGKYPVCKRVESTGSLGQTSNEPSDNLTLMSQREELRKRIIEMHYNGLSSRKIAMRLRRSGVEVSYKTVQRVLRDSCSHSLII